MARYWVNPRAFRASSLLVGSTRNAVCGMPARRELLSTAAVSSSSQYAWAETQVPPPSPGRGIFGDVANFEVTPSRQQKMEKWQWLLKMLGFVNEDDRLFRASTCVLQSCVNQSAIRSVYRALQLEPTFHGQQALLLAHVWLVHRRLGREGERGKVMQEQVFDRLWEETVVRIRFMGISEMSVNKQLRQVQQRCFGALVAYDRAVESEPTELQRILARHIMNDDGPIARRSAGLIASYLKREMKKLDKVDSELLMQGTIPWGKSIELNTQAPPLKGEDEYTIIGEQIGNWRTALDNRGKLYYWNLATRYSVWERPVGDDLNKGAVVSA